jgi:hypothetical protein
MTLSETQARDVLKSPKSKQEIDAVKRVESQLRVCTEEMSLAELQKETYWAQLLEVIKARSQKKFERVMMFARYPLPVVQLCDSVLSDYFRVFEGKNRFFNVDGDRDITKLNDWIEDSKPVRWVEKYAKQVFKNKPNSFCVIDQATNGTPYLVYVDSDRLIDAQIKDSEGNCEYIAFVHSQETITGVEGSEVVRTFFSVYDDANYYVFYKDSNTDAYILESVVSHGVGYCPAKSFIKTASNQKNKFKRRVAFSPAVSKLEDWITFDIMRNYVDHYAPFPITEAPINKCANQDCMDGKVATEIIDPATDEVTSTTYSTCPVCEGGTSGGQHIYPGTHIGIKVQPTKDLEDGSGKFRMIFPDVDKLKYVPEKLDKIELDVRYKTIGINNILSKEAVNELQAKGSFESMESVLLRTKAEMDALYKWIVITVGRLLYTNMYVDVDANFGTEFYLVSEEDLQKRYKDAKDAGLPMEELLMIYTQIIETKYKGNELKIQRQKMLLELDPLPLISSVEAVELNAKGFVDDFDLVQKINFLNFITKFENENTPITQFGSKLEHSKAVGIIKQNLNIYTDEIIKSKQLRKSSLGTE